MAQIKTMHEAFLHELGDTYDAEQQFLAFQQEALTQAQHAEVKQALRQHIAETQEQIANLEQVFQSLGEKVQKVSCKGAAGIIAENKQNLKETANKGLIDGMIVGGGGKVEHYEIASYRCLVKKAALMGHSEAERLLQQNLQQEEKTAQLLEQIEVKLGQEALAKGPALIGHQVEGMGSSASH